ncbi:MutH/Sau3AI family endonuclease [Flavobacterium beibuense]|uniref:DNA mismatch repair enzyme MutH n=1 Tax=Flavobacterium beibuense TaxID=657326 RepID=A0A444WD28_9FLAO|nr:MutH/Sau3AI family endonuclease [Flavobacterium beibuense]RYJ43716.1 DNA mismatch repair enzyme MutH [Flavobacterium beibuense]
MKYDSTNPLSIENYAKQLLNKSLRNVLGEGIVQNYTGKGRLGQLLEDSYFGYKPNSNSEPDFLDAGVELKTTPVKENSRGLVSKERLVFNIINFNEEYKKTFVDSSFWRKNQLLLLMFYLYEQEKIELDYIFKIIRLWQFPAPDLKIIKDDWEKIVLKIKEGKAHEISEGDTFYLGACTKGANKNSLVTQPFSDEKAMQRAFSLKSKYLNFIIKKSLADEEVIVDYEEYDKILRESNDLREPRSYYRRLNKDVEPIVKSLEEYEKGESFEDLVIKKFIPYYNLSEQEIRGKLGLAPSLSKNRYNVLARAILGVRTNKIEEFEKAGVEMKTIRLEKSGSLKENMSFAQIKFKEIINEDWEDSYWYSVLTRRFFFVIFQKDENEILRLKKVKFWTMPIKDLDVAEKFWEHTKAQILNNDFNNFIKISDNMICHVRPKGVNGKDLMETAFGTKEKKKSYWLNSSYIKNIIE